MKRIALLLALLAVPVAAQAWIHGSTGGGGGGGLPAGVTLSAIDGESMTGNTMSHTYYSANGFTLAHTAGWDSPSFFPIGPNASGSIDSAAVVTQYQQLGWQADWATGTSTTLSLIGSNASPPIWTIWNIQNGNPLAGTGAETVGLETFDEPSTYAIGISGPISTTANTYQTTRFWWMNNTASQIGGNLAGDPSPNTYAHDLTILITTPSGAGQTTRHINLASIDFYFFAGSLGDVNGNIGGVWNLNGTGANATADQCRRGFLYGDIVDWMRSQQPTYPAPILVYIEDSQPNGGPYTYTMASYIQPAELNQAVWQSIIHGARGIAYFDLNYSGPLTTGAQSNPLSQFGSTEDAFIRTVGAWNAANYPTGVVNPNGISMGAQITQTDAEVLALAPIINSPKANSYVTVSPASGEIQPLPLSVNGNSAFAGIDVRAMWYQGGTFTNSYNTTYSGGPTNFTNDFYVIASPRVSEATTSISATFTLAETSLTCASCIIVVGEGRTLAASGGVFSDTFASGLTVHIYQVNG